jgi:hypothetical protein
MQTAAATPTRIETTLESALARVHQHALWRELDAPDAATDRAQVGLALALAEWSAANLLCALRRALLQTRTPWVPAADGFASRLVLELSLLEEGCERARGDWCSRSEAFRALLARTGVPLAAFDAFVARLRAGERLRLAFSLSGLPTSAVSAAQQWHQACDRGWAHEIAATYAALRLALPPRGYVDHCRARLANHAERDELLRPLLELNVSPAGHGAARLAERLAAARPEGAEESAAAASSALGAFEALLDQLADQLAVRRAERRSTLRHSA